MSISIQRTDYQQRYLEQLEALQQRNRERLAEGKRIAQAADDSAGLAIARRLEATATGYAQGERNLADGRSLVQTAEASLQTSQSTVARMRELAVQAQNGALSAADRDVVQQEFDQQAAQLDQTAQATQFGGRPLLDGSVAGADAVQVEGGDGDPTNVEIAAAGAAAIGVQGLDVTDPASLDALDAAQRRLSNQRAGLGALDAAFARQESQAAAARVGAEEARSRIEDVDVARERARFVVDVVASAPPL